MIYLHSVRRNCKRQVGEGGALSRKIDVRSRSRLNDYEICHKHFPLKDPKSTIDPLPPLNVLPMLNFNKNCELNFLKRKKIQN